MDIIHIECCSTASVRKKCKNCYAQYRKKKYNEKIKKMEKETGKTQKQIRHEKKISEYEDILCNPCKEKVRQDYCPDCTKKYFRAASAKYRKEKSKNAISVCDLENIKSPSKKYKKKTIANKKTLINQIIGSSPRAKYEVINALVQDELSLENKKCVTRNLIPDFQEEVCGEIIKPFNENGKKEMKISIINSLSPILKNRPINSLCRSLHLGQVNAKIVGQGEQMQYKKTKRSFPEDSKNAIQEFYKRDDISRITQQKTKKNGNIRYMYSTLESAHKTFINENRNIKVCYNTFSKFRPVCVKTHDKTPMVSCLCMTCTNINLKLPLFRIPKINTAGQLYDILICPKEDEEGFREKNVLKRFVKNVLIGKPKLNLCFLVI